MSRRLGAIYLMSAVLAGLAGVASAASGPLKIVIAHRGASGYLPEHTLETYAFAYAQGADFIEPDLVLTRDGRFVAMHDIELESTTDVEERFPERKRENGHWYAGDFTLAELKTLRVHERLPKRFPSGKSDFAVPTLEEVIELVQGLNQTTGRNVGIYPELKSPSWHRKEGLAMEKPFLAVLTRYGYEGPDAKVFVQCFEPGTLKQLRNDLGSQLPMIQLVGSEGAGLLSEQRLDEIAGYANGIGPDKGLIEAKPEIVAWAHARGLLVHPYTLRADAVPAKYEEFEDEVRMFFFQYDVDGFFTDFPDRAAAVLRAGSSEAAAAR